MSPFAFEVGGRYWYSSGRLSFGFANGNPLITWYVGGLNHQIEHHLFPKVCSVHYPALAPIVREVTREHGLPYYHQPTLFSAIRSHFRTLQRHARRPLATA